MIITCEKKLDIKIPDWKNSLKMINNNYFNSLPIDV